GSPAFSQGAAIEGRVVGPDKKPIEKARIEAFREAAAPYASLQARLTFLASKDEYAVAVASAETDADGGFRLEAPAQGWHALRVRAPGFGIMESWGQAAPASDVEIALEKAVRRTGVVREIDGKPIANATI